MSDRTFPLLQFEVRALNYRTGKLERVTDDNWRDFVPQMPEALDYYDALLLDGERPVDAAIEATVFYVSSQDDQR